MSQSIAVHLLTGFLGSGKTTLLNHILRSPEYANCAVLVNEFGEIGVDHHLIESIHGDVILMRSGCICCSIRGDLAESITTLHTKRDAHLIPAFERLIIETTGLADPTTLLATLIHERTICHHFHIANIITTVDVLHAMNTLQRFPQALKQIALANCIVLTKTDLANDSDTTDLNVHIRSINPLAQIWSNPNRPPSAEALLSVPHSAALTSTPRPPLGVHRTLARPHSVFAQNVQSFTLLPLSASVDSTVLGVWLTLLLHTHGDNILRFKGLLNVTDCDAPVVIHGVQHLVHPPSHLAHCPPEYQNSLNLSGSPKVISADDLRRSLHQFLAIFSPTQALGI